ncbi:MAG: alpha-amylase, partial [bacterium]|nr:alpha-amylase [bacterium]
QTDGIPHRHFLLEEMMMLWLSNVNPALSNYKEELFDDSSLSKKTAYKKIFAELDMFFQLQPPFGPDNQDLLTMLRSPAKEVPDSIPGQLNYIREHWGLMLKDILSRLLSGLDFIKEEEKFGGHGAGETPVFDFSRVSLMEDHESFSPDKHWMPRLVLLAKSTYIWLDQLSKKYDREITRLDHVPDEELDEMANRGFTGLWLIGLWERSRASQKIKQMCGNPEALASAYSVFDYRIADDLGGEEAVNSLKQRAQQRGLRLAGDMVPNHMGIDSPWLVEHPDRFLQLDYCPYPNYTFNGTNLSTDDRISIFLEDHYYDRTDAAVVFKWVNNHSGQVRYIYHGNDGTSMPWNDTAQLNYLNPDTKEAVIEAIFSVARNFPVIRFDAAMTLSNKHYQRLWFPEPGSGGDIPTRAAHGMTIDEFHKQMPHEFWRQVVDRFADAQSDTLLLAEAFWLMEAYFVRTLGMHRVYNSAFMHFLKNEDNAQFRTSIKNVLQFNPEILKRFVNFMNNPDEDTAVAQFGKDDKYFGVCTLMATLPGLPMFGHGQVEGFGEKYGMEYRRAYWDETPDPHLGQRHDNEIFPLLRKRYLFAEVENFLLYDFHTPEGWVNENVIAYSNSFENQSSLVVYNNKFDTAAGWLKTSTAFKTKSGDDESLVQKQLSEGLGLNGGDNHFTIFRDQAADLEFIRNSKELAEKGMYIELEAFKRNVFLDFREVEDHQGIYRRLHDMLQGRGVASIENTLRRYFLNPLLGPFKELVNPVTYKKLHGQTTVKDKVWDDALWKEVETKLSDFYKAVVQLTDGKADASAAAKQVRQKMERLTRMAFVKRKMLLSSRAPLQEAMNYFMEPSRTHSFFNPTLFAWAVIHQLGDLMPEASPKKTMALVEEWLLWDEIAALFYSRGASDTDGTFAKSMIEILLNHPGLLTSLEEKTTGKNAIKAFFKDTEVRRMINVNLHEGVEWFHKESCENLFYWFLTAWLTELPLESEKVNGHTDINVERVVMEGLERRCGLIKSIITAIEDSGYHLERLPEHMEKRTGK